MNREELIQILRTKSRKLTKAEADFVGPLESRDIAPVTGDLFTDEMLAKKAQE